MQPMQQRIQVSEERLTKNETNSRNSLYIAHIPTIHRNASPNIRPRLTVA